MHHLLLQWPIQDIKSSEKLKNKYRARPSLSACLFSLQWLQLSEAGTGIGYTGIRIRGSDASRINVTIDGIPLNDSESQQVFWVNMPDIVASVSEIQVQRGVGTSTNGAGAFGASINMTWRILLMNHMQQLSTSLGSFSTRKHRQKLVQDYLEKGLNLT